DPGGVDEHGDGTHRRSEQPVSRRFRSRRSEGCEFSGGADRERHGRVCLGLDRIRPDGERLRSVVPPNSLRRRFLGRYGSISDCAVCAGVPSAWRPGAGPWWPWVRVRAEVLMAEISGGDKLQAALNSIAQKLDKGAEVEI